MKALRLLSFATLVGMIAAVEQNPDLAKGEGVPPLYMFLPLFVKIGRAHV